MGALLDRHTTSRIDPDAGAAPGPGAARYAGHGIVAVSLIVLAVVAFLPALDNAFSDLDDSTNFVTNRHYRGLGWRQLRWAWQTRLLGVYQPLSWMIFSAEYSAFGLSARGYHLVSVMFHAVNAVVLYTLTLAVVRRVEPGPAAGGRWGVEAASGLAAALFMAHPMRVEVVTWPSSQPYLPCAFFFMLSVLAYLRAHPAGRPVRTGWLYAAFALFWASLLCKAPAVTLPAVLIVLDFYPLRRLGGPGGWLGPGARRAWMEKLPFLALAVAFSVIAGEARAENTGPYPLLAYPGLRLAHACYSVWFYPALTVLPFGLNPYYPVTRIPRPTDPTYLLCIVLVIGVSAALVRARRRRPGLLATWACYLSVLAPMSGLFVFGMVIAADRYSYLPAISWAPLTAVALWRAGRRGGPARLAAGVAVVAFAALLVLTRAQCRVWRDPETTWRHVLAHTDKSNYMAHSFLGAALTRKGETHEAVGHFLEAVRINPRALIALCNLGVAKVAMGEFADAEVYYARAVRLVPDDPELRTHLAFTLGKQGHYEAAIPHLAAVTRLRPELADGYHNLGYVLARLGKPGEAVTYFSKALERKPDFPDAHFEMGCALEGLGRRSEAVDHYAEAFRLKPSYTEAREALERARVALRR